MTRQPSTPLVATVTVERLAAAISAVSSAPLTDGGRSVHGALLEELAAFRDTLDQPDEPAPRLCPHCLAALTPGAVDVAVRCQTCRLLVGAGRSLSTESGATSGRSAGAAAGSLSARVRREAGALSGGDPLAAARDVREVAERLGVKADRLRMVDYQAAWDADRSLMSLVEVVGACRDWKTARLTAARSDLSFETVKRPGAQTRTTTTPRVSPVAP